MVVGVSLDGEVHETILEDSRQHNELLIPTTLSVLETAGCDFATLDAIVVGCGPGPFTGLRVGMATGAALGDALGVPVHGVCSHDAIASLIDAEHTLVVTDARRREIYYTAYRGAERAVGPEVVAPAKLDLGEYRADVVSAAEHLFEQLPEVYRVTRTFERPTVAGLVAVADFAAKPGPLTPLYLRRPDAKEPAAKPRSAAIPDVAALLADADQPEGQ